MRCDHRHRRRHCSRKRIISTDYRQTFRRNVKEHQAPPTAGTCSFTGVKEPLEQRQNPQHPISLMKAGSLFPPCQNSLPPRADPNHPLSCIHPHRCCGALAAVPCLALLSNILIRTAQTPLRCSRIPEGSGRLCGLLHLCNSAQMVHFCFIFCIL